jgi:hypothetical protein
MSDVEPGVHRRIWAIGLAAIKDELGSEPVESVGDLLRLGEKILAAGVDVGARFDAIGEDASARIVPRKTKRASSRRAKVLRAQGAYYLVSGLWAVVDRRGFEAVTGRKKEYWLVRMVGLLAGAIGLSLLAGARGGRPSSETTVLGVAAGASFTAVDLVYVARRRISPVYLGDATVHGVLAAFALLRSRESGS